MTEDVGLVSKRLLATTKDIGGITDIAWRSPATGARRMVIVAGTAGALFLEPLTYNVERFIQLNDGGPPHLKHLILDADGDGDIELLRLPSASEDTSLSDDLGHTLWKARCPSHSFPFVSWGDLDGDKKLEFLLYGLLSAKVRLVDSSGKVLRDEVWDRGLKEVRIADLDGDGEDEIVYLDGKKVVVRNGQGEVIARGPPPEAGYVNSLEVLPPAEGGGPARLRVGAYRKAAPPGEDRQAYWILEADATTVVRKLTRDELDRSLALKPVRLGGARGFRASIREAKYQGYLVGYSATRLVLKVFDAKDAVVYGEVLAASSGEVAFGDGAMAAVPSSTPGEENLLVGYGPDLWELEIKK